MDILIKEATQFGAGIFLAVIVLIGYWVMTRESMRRSDDREQARYDERQKLNERMLDVIGKNTEAVTAMRDVASQSCMQMTAHQTQADAFGVVLRDTHRMVEDIHDATVQTRSEAKRARDAEANRNING